jgi:hypothetical protein
MVNGPFLSALKLSRFSNVSSGRKSACLPSGKNNVLHFIHAREAVKLTQAA